MGPVLTQLEPKDTLRAKILVYLRDHGECSIGELARNLNYSMSNVRDRLLVAKRLGQVEEHTARVLNPSGGPVLSHFHKITEEGKKWLVLVAEG